jgi:hypothetical protein
MTMFSFMIAFKPPEYSTQLTNEWKTYFKKSILPKLEGDFEWSQEKSGWGNLEGEDHERVYNVKLYSLG